MKLSGPAAAQYLKDNGLLRSLQGLRCMFSRGNGRSAGGFGTHAVDVLGG